MAQREAGRLWAGASYAYGLIVVIGLGYALLGLPIQVADGFTNMLALIGRPLLSGVYNEFFQRSYLRPFLWGHHEALFMLAGNRYFEWFRGWHVFQVLLLVLLFIRLLGPRTRLDAAVVPLGLAVLIGIHTFAGTVLEAFPVNTFMTVLLCCLGAANLAIGSHRWWHDVLAVIVFVFAALTVESGLLVWVVLVAAYLTGARGVSRLGIVAATLCFGGYFYLRFAVLDIGGPGLIERSSGYGFAVRSPAELIERFGTHPWPFYAYNVVTSMVSVLWSEPRAGVWRVASALTRGEIRPYMLVDLIASTLATAVLLAYIWRRRKEWRARRFETGDQVVLVFIAVLVANATISYPYTKDVIMSPAGMFYALAVAIAARDLLITASERRVWTASIVVLLALLSGAWAIRATAIHVALRASAVAVRQEWAYVDQWLEGAGTVPTDPAAVRLLERLRYDAIVRHPGSPMLSGDFVEDWLGVE